MKNATKIIGLAMLAAVVLACGNKKPHPSMPPYIPVTQMQGFSAAVDPAMARLYGDPPIYGRLPRSLTWSPDGQRVLFLRTRDMLDGEPQTELWLLEMTGLRETPLLQDPELPVDEFAWIDDGSLVFASGGDLHVLSLDGKTRRLTETEGAEEGVQASPDGKRIAFVRDHDLYLIDLKTGVERRVTGDGTSDRYYGGVTWVYGEELSTEKGFGWSEDGKRLWLYAVDETEVTKRTVVASPDGKTSVQTYPRPGEKNPVIRVGVADVDSPAKEEIVVRWMETGGDGDIYLPLVTWRPGGEKLAVIRMDRLQTVLELLECDAKKAACDRVLEERDPRWVNLLGEPRYLADGKSFLWLSERSGFSHIYLMGADGVVKRQLTQGEWVVSSVDHVDEKGGWVYFTANAAKPISYGIYRVPLAGGEMEAVSAPGGVHGAIFSPDSKRYLDNHTSMEIPPQIDLMEIGVEDEIGGVRLATVAANDLGRYSSPEVANDIFPIDVSDGTRFWAQLTRPRAYEAGRRYPVLVYVYGGPGAQVVQDHFRTSFQGWRNLLASRGILVFSLDNRGSSGRGRAFEMPIHRELGAVELEDQLAGVEYLKKQPYVDPERMVIFGWSYGGYMVLKALLETKGVFKAGVSVAPVTDWREYDTAYSERYMQRPDDNPDGYRRTRLLDKAANLETPLLLVHGMADDNVHMVNSALMTEALIKEGKLFDWAFYPGKKHGIRGGEWRTQLFSKITRFIERYI